MAGVVLLSRSTSPCESMHGHSWTFSELVIASIIEDSRCGISDVAFHTAPRIGGLSCLLSLYPLLPAQIKTISLAIDNAMSEIFTGSRSTTASTSRLLLLLAKVTQICDLSANLRLFSVFCLCADGRGHLVCKRALRLSSHDLRGFSQRRPPSAVLCNMAFGSMPCQQTWLNYDMFSLHRLMIGNKTRIFRQEV